MFEEFPGYKGKALSFLRKASAEIGDIIRIYKEGETYEGTLIPRSEYGDDKFVVIKLKSGYNVGIRIDPTTQIKKVGVGAKPTFSSPRLPDTTLDLPKVVFLSTGGTIASRVDYRSGAVRPALSASDLYSIVPELSEIARVDSEILFSLYSENITPKHWSDIARKIAQYLEKDITGIVVAHGTDTLGYTAAALSFALQNLPIPVVLVASQRSSDRPSSDAAINLIGTVRTATQAPFAEVVVAMHQTTSDKSIILHRGTKVRKCHTSRRDAFRSINTEPIARIENESLEMLIDGYTKRDSTRNLILKPKFDEKVALIKFHPGLNPEIIEWYIDRGYKGIILEGTGLGHVGHSCFSAIKRAVENNLVVAISSQCIWGRLGMNVYDTGRDLLTLGVLPLEDILAETALVKLMWVFGQTQNIKEAKSLLQTNISHEFSPRSLHEVMEANPV